MTEETTDERPMSLTEIRESILSLVQLGLLRLSRDRDGNPASATATPCGKQHQSRR